MNKKAVKKPISEKQILKNMMIGVYTISAVFLFKNLISGTWTGAITIGICLLIFSFLSLFMKKKKISEKTRQLVTCITVVCIVFCVSLNSGSYYSDDFPLYLAVIALSGLYLVPKYTLIQTVLIDIFLLASYLIHPEKADPFSQYAMCMFLLTFCAFCFYIVIKRGHTFIEISETHAAEAELLLTELKNAGEQLQESCDQSIERISHLEKANENLEGCISELRSGSASIIQGTVEVTHTFDDMQSQMLTTQKQVEGMNTEVKNVETSLSANQKNMNEMNTEMEILKKNLEATNAVFTTLQNEINEIVRFTKELNKIATNTTTLALNASIEAARAGQMGAGFAVVAAKVQTLAEDSNQCSSQIASVVSQMEDLIRATAVQLSESHTAVDTSILSLNEFQNSFDQLTTQFASLYNNIEEQNSNIKDMDHSFIDLRDRISDMASSSEENQHSVDSITASIDIYKNNIDKIVEDNVAIRNLSSALLNSEN